MSLADLYEVMASNDEEMSKEASELEKIAAEENAAGRIMARGFMDELNKLAALPANLVQQARAAGRSAASGSAPAMKPVAPKRVPMVPPARTSVVNPGKNVGTVKGNQHYNKSVY